MDLPPEADEEIRESTTASVGGSFSAKTLQLELLASEDERRRLQDQIFLLEDRLAEAARRFEQHRAEANMNAQGLRRCVEEKEAIAAGCADLASRRAKLEEECALYEGDIGTLIESCDDLARENEELKLPALASEVEFLREDKEHLTINLRKAEAEVIVLFEENSRLDEDNKRLLKKLNIEHHSQGSGGKHSAGGSTKVKDMTAGKAWSYLGPLKGKRKQSPSESFFDEKVIDFYNPDLARQPLSPLQHNSPGTRLRKK